MIGAGLTSLLRASQSGHPALASAQLAPVAMALRIRPWLASRLPAVASASVGVRRKSGIRILDDAAKAAEDLYWAHEDERLLKKMIQSHPELDPSYIGIEGLDESVNTLSDKVKMIFIKHGIPPVNKALIADITALVEQSAQAQSGKQ
eukprot:TRINITY_DN19253_c0_g2_i1.p1 TRINITY_DN19253_c0_g2~~TRINITY_DN19253_c0_g2_i1.p1  ORF type:complete len:148 (-),score=32.49 TRINITY_DN19253_c0_g2_i1:93-536(-)